MKRGLLASFVRQWKSSRPVYRKSNQRLHNERTNLHIPGHSPLLRGHYVDQRHGSLPLEGYVVLCERIAEDGSVLSKTLDVPYQAPSYEKRLKDLELDIRIKNSRRYFRVSVPESSLIALQAVVRMSFNYDGKDKILGMNGTADKIEVDGKKVSGKFFGKLNFKLTLVKGKPVFEFN